MLSWFEMFSVRSECESSAASAFVHSLGELSLPMQFVDGSECVAMQYSWVCLRVCEVCGLIHCGYASWCRSVGFVTLGSLASCSKLKSKVNLHEKREG